jgi:superfamily I DNA/RNA helicase/DNA polymerase III epsilon subunit-like protein
MSVSKIEKTEDMVVGPDSDGNRTAPVDGLDTGKLIAELNLQQVRAVMEPGPLLVLAGPGSGKTRILTHRAAWLVAEKGALPRQVLCVTFTNKAADEMRGRLEALLGDTGRDLRIHTFHALCARLLRQYGEGAGLNPRFVVADETNQTDLVIEIMRRREFSLETLPAYKVLAFISEYKRDLKVPAHASPDEEHGLTTEIIEVAAEYDRVLRERGLLDFDDLIVQTVRILARDRALRASLQVMLPHVLVDEYQDINRAQFVLLQLLAPQGGDIIAVADDAQSIYGWRGAQPELIANFRKYYRPQVIELNQSYRSTETILYAAQNMVRHGDGPERQRQFLKTDQGRGEPIYHYVFATERQEQDWLVRLVQRLVKERGHSYGDIAILYRTHQLADEVEGALLQAQIPVQRVRKESFFDEPLAREVVRYLHLVRSLNSDNLLAAFNFPQTLADELTVLQLQHLADVHRLPLADLARQGESFPELSPLTRANLAAFMRLFDELLVPRAEKGAAAVVAALFELLGRRRSPFSESEFRTLRDAGAFLRFAEPAAAMRDYLASGGQPTITVPATVDGICAAAILSDTVARYLGGVVSVVVGGGPADKVSRATHDSDATTHAKIAEENASYEVSGEAVLGPDVAGGASPVQQDEDRPLQDVQIADDPERRLEIQLGSESEPILVQPPGGSLAYSLTTVAWRLAQELLVAHETLAAGPVVVYDLETTGTDVRRDEIIEIGAQRLEDGAPIGPDFYSLVRPMQAIPREATRIHGIHTPDVQGAEAIATVLPRFLRYVGANTVVGHNIRRFDNRIIDRETGRLLRRGFPNPAVDTLEMARRLYQPEPGIAESLALQALLQRFGLAEKVEHRAAGDVAQITALFRHLLAENSLQLSMRALPEYLPLVALGMAAAGVPRRDENDALWQGARRMLARLADEQRLVGAAVATPGTEGDVRSGDGEAEAQGGQPAAGSAGSDLTGQDEAVLIDKPEGNQDWSVPVTPAGLAIALGLSVDTPRFQAAIYAALAALPDEGPVPVEDRAWVELRDRFLDQVATFDRFAYDHSLGAFLDYQALVGGLDTARLSQAGKVTMMTLHNAKGTEFPVVIIMGLEDENLPLWTTLGDERQLAEERRVFYVGLTRARHRLYLTSVRERKAGAIRSASRFVFDLPRRYVRRYQIGPRGDLRQLA